MFPIAISPCPNDTALFYPWICGLVGKELPLKVCFADIQKLNELALEKKYPLIKISVGAYLGLEKHYSLLPVGAALGHHCGPKVVAKHPFDLKDLKNKTVAIPGQHTTAHMLFNLLVPKPQKKLFCLYHEISSLINQGKADCGVIIHESRFTFQAQGFHEIADLGGLWHKKTALPLPLGALALKKGEPKEKITAILQQAYEHKNNPTSRGFIVRHAQEKNWEVIQKHIALYVNKETYHLSDVGMLAIDTLLQMAKKKDHDS